MWVFNKARRTELKALRTSLREAKSIEQDYRCTLASRRHLGMKIPGGILDAWMDAMTQVEFLRMAIRSLKKGEGSDS